MCGIVGLIDNTSGQVNSSLLFTMRDTMTSRGPDGEGHYIKGPVGMAMRRLSIIDLSKGWQPFFSKGDKVVAFQNGEIYNYRVLKQRLIAKGYSFISDSDTEVIAHGYSEWGIDGLLEKIDGMYAIAILDRPNRCLHLARDRFGEKPLFYVGDGKHFAYSSDLVTLASLPWVSNEIDLVSLNRYLATHYIPGERTIIGSIKRVLPGCYISIHIDDLKLSKTRYYRIPINNERKSNDDELEEKISEAVESRLIADVPVGVFLSGGLDSSIVAAIVAKKHPEIATFSMGFGSSRHDESMYAEAVAQKIGSRHYRFVFDEDSFRDLFPKVAEVLDEPIGDQAMLPLYWLCKEARQHVSVVLAGEGADEVFAGYGYYGSFIRKRSWDTKIKILLGKASSKVDIVNRLIDNNMPITPSGFPLLTDINGRSQLINFGEAGADDWELDLMEWVNISKDSLQRATITDMTTWLPDDLLVKFDRMAMAHSLEGRAPFLSPQVVETGINLPQSQRMISSASKVALRRIARRWLPNDILERPKHGFVLPMKKWLKQWFTSQNAQDYFLRHPIPGLNMEAIGRLVHEEISGELNRERLIFALIILCEWYESFLKRRNNLRKRYEVEGG